jgi:putative tricarboxylic transport membrane protein
VAGVALLYVLEARRFEAGFIADPVGPAGFPYVIGILALVASAVLFFGSDPPRRDPAEPSFLLRAAILIGALALYALFLESAGFVLSTSLLMTVLVVIYRGRILLGFAGALLVSLGLFYFFAYALSVPLPFGRLFGGE